MKALYRNNNSANAVITNMLNHIMLDGFKFSAQIPGAAEMNKLIEKEFHHFSHECDAADECTFEEMTRLAVNDMLINGDTFAYFVRPKDTSSKYQLKIRMIEANAVDTPKQNVKAYVGIETDSFNDKVAVWFRKSQDINESYTAGAEDFYRVPFKDANGLWNVCHIYHPIYYQQLRGVPILTSSYNRLLDLDTFIKSEVMAAMVASNFNMYITTPHADQRMGQTFAQTGARGTKGNDPKQSTRPPFITSPGAINILLPGEDIKQVQLNRPNNGFPDFVEAVLGQVAASLGMSYAFLYHQPGELNFANSRFDNNQCQVALKGWQATINRRFLEPVKQQFLVELLANEVISLPDGMELHDLFRACSFQAPTFKALDINKEIKAVADGIAAGVMTHKQGVLHLYGGDWADTFRQLGAEYKLKEALGIPDKSFLPEPEPGTAPDPMTNPNIKNSVGKPPGDNSTRG